MRYRSRIIPLYEGHRQEDKGFWGYRYAASPAQALRFLERAYPYPQYIVEAPVEDPRMNVVVRTNPQLDRTVSHIGYESIEIDKADGLQTDAELIAESQKKLSELRTIDDSSLSSSQQACLSLAREISNDATPKRVRIYAAIIPPASDRVKTAGVYSRAREEIYISPEQLERGKTTIDTILHEMAHNTSGAEDGEDAHNREISRLGELTVSRTSSGRYDAFINDDFVW